MSIPGSASPLFFGAGAEAAAFQIDRSIRLNSGDSAHLSRTPSSASNRKTWTWSGWVKRSAITTSDAHIFTATAGSGLDNTNYFAFLLRNQKILLGGAANIFLLTEQVFRDPSAWYHIVASADTTQATASDRLKLYVNGSLVTDFDTDARSSAITQNMNLGYNNNVAHAIGSNATTGDYFNGYITEVNFVDGQQLAATDFGEYDDNNVWQAKDTSGLTFGTNGFRLKFDDNSSNAALGNDSSGNDNDWTVNNLSVSTGGPTSVATATGALPIHNTTDTYGATKGTGTRTDSNSSSIVLAIPMDGSNGGTTFTDESATIKGSGSAKSITVSSATTSTAQSQFYGSSAGAFSRSSAPYLSIADQADLEFGSGDFTIEVWVYLTNSTSQYEGIFSKPGSSDQNGFNFYKETNGTIRFIATTGTGNNWAIDVGLGSCSDFANKWVHFAISREGSNIRGFVNGVLTATSTAGGTIVDNSNPLYIGKYTQFPGSVTYGFDGYLSDFRIYKGVAKYTSNFNPPSSTQNTTIAAGNDSLIDSPTNYEASSGNNGGNYCTFNSGDKASSVTLSNGNLDFIASTSNHGTRGTIGVNSGKLYWEVTVTTANNGQVGIAKSTASITTQIGGDADGYSFHVGNGNKQNNGSYVSYGSGCSSGDVVGVALDLDSSTTTLTFYKNGSSLGTAYSGISGTFLPAVSRTSGSSVEFAANFGQRPFAYTPPTGYVSLCTQNLPDPTIADGSTAMDAVTYTGTGSSQSITTSFSPDLVWIKSRSVATGHSLFDTIRGALERLQSNSTAAEATANGTLTSFDTDGFTLGAGTLTNQSSASQVAWAWDAGSSTVSNTDGDITSSVRANTSAGFSIVSYTGNGTVGATVGHGLGANVALYFIKNRTTANSWAVIGHALNDAFGGSYKYLNLDTNGAAGVASQGPGNSSTIELYDDASNNSNGDDFIAYCFSSVDQFSSFGSYEGNNSSDGPFVLTGMRPRWIMIKNADSTGAWAIYDTARDDVNAAEKRLFPNLDSAESDAGSNALDILSNGFKIRSTGNVFNSSSTTYLYAAFGDPFKTARAR